MKTRSKELIEKQVRTNIRNVMLYFKQERKKFIHAIFGTQRFSPVPIQMAKGAHLIASCFI